MTTVSTAAAIEYVPDLLVLQNANADQVKTVSYLDQALQQEYSDDLKARVQRMIRKQMKEMDAEKDYLGDKLVVPKLTLLESPWMQAEIERVLLSKKQQSSDVEMTDDSYTKVVSEPKQKTV